MCIRMCVSHLTYICVYICITSDVDICIVSDACMYVCIVSSVWCMTLYRIWCICVCVYVFSLALHAGIYKCLCPALSTMRRRSAHALCRSCVSSICFSRASLCLTVSALYIYSCVCLLSCSDLACCLHVVLVLPCLFCLVCVRAALQVVCCACYVSFE